MVDIFASFLNFSLDLKYEKYVKEITCKLCEAKKTQVKIKVSKSNSKNIATGQTKAKKRVVLNSLIVRAWDSISP